MAECDPVADSKQVAEPAEVVPRQEFCASARGAAVQHVTLALRFLKEVRTRASSEGRAWPEPRTRQALEFRCVR
jgi:hypothetical protein